MRVSETVLDCPFELGLNGIGSSGIEAQDHEPTATLSTQAKSVHL